MHSKTSLVGLSTLAYLHAANAAAMSLASNLTIPVQFAVASYRQVDSYTSINFFSSFNFFTGSDPTHGFVDYQSQSNAQNRGLINTNNGQIYLGVDHTTTNPSPGRASVRLTSNKAYNHGLFIADIAHMPGSICGVWPAFWLFGPNWPNSGEIDVLEGVNLAGTNSITLHTSAGCTINIGGSQGGTNLNDANCNSNNGYNGCGVTTTVPNAYGDGFNNNGGGVYAMQWESSGIYVWFFPRNNIPADIRSGNPVTGNWGLPIVAFNGGSGCNIDQHFMNQNIVFDTTFCGDWAGGVWGGTCASRASSCNNYVAQNPGVFAPAYWTINSVKVYQL
ncbi:Mixed-linked glucanase [Venustampulla echinocandica]|uniref:endo-1,3(4)-beta-glucanase n=1 Tax=Venustampulla echinocandica TaxID=2656787 RepID=A0A370TV64_9HELO|nr:Mixed-linked glucanase [Venustampulla echinocandica]RDL39358.1 Mixed-linked glucanase [Venustampulla echinocandica]